MTAQEKFERNALRLKQGSGIFVLLLYIAFVFLVLRWNVPYPKWSLLAFLLIFWGTRAALSLLQNRSARKRGLEPPYPKTSQLF